MKICTMCIWKKSSVIRKYCYIVFVIAFIRILYLKGLCPSKWNKYDEDCTCHDLKDRNKVETRTNKTVQIFGVQTTLGGNHDQRLVKITWAEFQKTPNALSGNPLIDNYGQNDPWGDGSGIILAGKEKEKAAYGKEKYKINVYASDKIPLNRMVPDARFSGGIAMVGAGFAVEKRFFEEIGTFDGEMSIWGGENLELAWRIWLCGGRLVHVPCSHIGHMARFQPYTFPGGREVVQQFNYKRAVEVWMEPEHKELIYDSFPNMSTLDVGDLTDRLQIKERLKCKPFSWFIDNIYPELFVLNRHVTAWGSARNLHTGKCLDNYYYLHQGPAPLFADPCHYKFSTQGFSMTNEKVLRSYLQCVVVKEYVEGTRPQLEGCLTGPKDTWVHKQGDYIMHEKTGLCLDLDDTGPVMKKCDPQVPTQLWQFNTYIP